MTAFNHRSQINETAARSTENPSIRRIPSAVRNTSVIIKTLPKDAFLPTRPLNARERMAFSAQRDRLFLLCTPTEQRCIAELALWYANLHLEVLAKPNIFTNSYSVWFNHRYSLLAKTKLNLVVLGLAKVSGLIHKIERWLGRRAQSSLMTRIRTLVHEDEIDVLVGVIAFLRMLPLDFGLESQRQLEEQLNALAAECLRSKRVPAVRRFDAILRCVARSYNDLGYAADPARLRKQAWPVLLDVAQEDLEVALRLIDEHWNQTRRPQILMSLDLHEKPELAYQLAVTLRPHHAGFAADMLRTLIFDATYQVKKLDRPAAAALEKIIDGSCRMLANWTFGDPRGLPDPQDTLKTITCLLRFGSPQADYWARLPSAALDTLKDLTSEDQDKQLPLMAQVVFYGENPTLVNEAQELFGNTLAHKFSSQNRWSREMVAVASDSLSILEDKILSHRNPFFAASPNHPLLHTVEAQLEVFLERLQRNDAACALRHLVALTLALSNENLIRKHHRILRAEFKTRAHENPADAGLALKKLIKYCGYSQMNDEVYRTALCEESFNELVPQLDDLSPADAAVARTGIGWTPRDGFGDSDWLE